MHARALKRLDRDQVCHVDSERLSLEAVLAQLVRDPLAEPVRDPGLDGHAAHRRDTGAEVLLREPRREELVVARRRSEVPQDRLGTAGSSAKRAFLSRAHSPMCVLVTYRMLFGSNRSTRAEIRCFERLGTVEAILAQSREVDALLPVHRTRRVRGTSSRLPGHRTTSSL